MEEGYLENLDNATQASITKLINLVDEEKVLNLLDELENESDSLKNELSELNVLEKQMEKSLSTIASSNLTIANEAVEYKTNLKTLERLQELVSDSVLPGEIYKKYPRDFSYLLSGQMKNDLPKISRVYTNEESAKFCDSEEFATFLKQIELNLTRFLIEHFDKMIVQPYIVEYKQFQIEQIPLMVLDVELQELQEKYLKLLIHFSDLVSFLFTTDYYSETAAQIVKIRCLEDNIIYENINMLKQVIGDYKKCIAFAVTEAEFFSPFGEEIVLFSKKIELKERKMASEKLTNQLSLANFGYLNDIVGNEEMLRELAINVLLFDFSNRGIKEINYEVISQIANDSQERGKLTNLYEFEPYCIESIAFDFIEFSLVAVQREEAFYERVCGNDYLKSKEIDAEVKVLKRSMAECLNLLFESADLPGAIYIVNILIEMQEEELIDFYSKMFKFKFQVSLNEMAVSVKYYKYELFAIRLGVLMRGQRSCKSVFEKLDIEKMILAAITNCEIPLLEKIVSLNVIGEISGLESFTRESRNLASGIASE